MDELCRITTFIKVCKEIFQWQILIWTQRERNRRKGTSAHPLKEKALRNWRLKGLR